jgi:phosphopantetheinyl transferase (holo-ACP synthase)
MTSTGNDIVALKAINIARTQQPNFYLKIISAEEKNLYDQRFSDKLPLGHFVWLLWSVKESAYKYLQRITPELAFSPTRILITLLELPTSSPPINFEGNKIESRGFDKGSVYKGIAGFGTDLLYFSSVINDDFIFTVVNCEDNFGDICWGIELIDSAEPAHQSKAVREFLLNRLNNLFPGGKWQIEKNVHSCPFLLKEGFEIAVPVSLTHHDGWVGYVFQVKD